MLIGLHSEQEDTYRGTRYSERRSEQNDECPIVLEHLLEHSDLAPVKLLT